VLRRGEDGASMVEFAIVLPVFALLLFAMIDFGLAFQSLIGMRNGVNAGAREASVSQTDPSCASPVAPTSSNPMICTVQDRIGNLLGVTPNSVQVAISFPAGNSNVGSPVKVCAQAKLKSTTGVTAPFLTGRVISTVSEIRLEQHPSYSSGSTGTISC
jgi:Flp pilus assembly protein TadG